jgi:hypothetical protein
MTPRYRTHYGKPSARADPRRFGDTVELAETTNVKAHAKNRITAVKETAQQNKDAFVSKTRQATPQPAGAGARQVTAAVQRKPPQFTAGGAFAAGALVGWLVGRR